MKYRKLGIIIILVIVLLCVADMLYAYEPLTTEQADNYVASIDYDTLLDIVIDYDYLEHTVPQVVLPRTDYVLFETDLTINYADGLKIHHSGFSYVIDIPNQIVYNFIEPTKPSVIMPVLYFVLGTGLGVLIGGIL